MINVALGELLLNLHQKARYMADNYLEKKMEEHRRGVAAVASSRKRSPTGSRRGTVALRIDPLRVFVTDAAPEVGQAVVRRLREAGCSVAFVAENGEEAVQLARSSGARFYPRNVAGGAVADLMRQWRGIDAVIITDGCWPDGVASAGLKRVVNIGSDAELPDVAPGDGLTVNAISTRGITAADAAEFCLYLCLKSSSFIDRRLFEFA